MATTGAAHPDVDKDGKRKKREGTALTPEKFIQLLNKELEAGDHVGLTDDEESHIMADFDHGMTAKVSNVKPTVESILVMREDNVPATERLKQYNKDAVDLEKDFATGLEKFITLRPKIQTVNKSFSRMREFIKDGSLPPDTRILPEWEWEDKSGTHLGFEYFKDYCLIVLKRSKQAVYHMLTGPTVRNRRLAKQENEETVIKKGGSVLNTLFTKARAFNAKLEFSAFVERLVQAAIAESTEAVKKAGEKAKKDNGDLDAMKLVAASAKSANHSRKPTTVAAG